MFAWMVLGMAFYLLLVCSYWLLYPYNPATFRVLPHKVAPSEVKRGGALIISVDVCKNMHIAPTIYRSYVDGIIYAVPTYITVDDNLGCRIRRVQIDVPNALPLGTYFINTVYKFKVNPLREIEMQTRTEKFEVIR